jgi:hypothetical protein
MHAHVILAVTTARRASNIGTDDDGNTGAFETPHAQGHPRCLDRYFPIVILSPQFPWNRGFRSRDRALREIYASCLIGKVQCFRRLDANIAQNRFCYFVSPLFWLYGLLMPASICCRRHTKVAQYF